MIVGLLVLLELILVACLLWFIVRNKPGQPPDLGFFDFLEQRIEKRKPGGGEHRAGPDASINRQG